MFHLIRGNVYLLVIFGASFSFLYTGLVTMFTYIVLILYIYIYIYNDVCLFHLPVHVLFLFSLYTHISLHMQSFYFYFTLRCLDEFCLKCFRNTGCQIYHAMNFLLAKFSRVCDRIRYYCIQQVFMSLVVYDFSHTLFVCCGFFMNCQKERLLGHMWNMLWTYVI